VTISLATNAAAPRVSAAHNALGRAGRSAAEGSLNSADFGDKMG